ncbi:choline trimethylamine-lyase [Serratia ficaria]|uniref:choline trimethylamine-lyase n=1 Tax=Serratia ficaria TaxID=61651 RepID=UPI00217C2DF6|nr:choline trimethylamine-lyase [Serratia ficaria]CAI1242479.1 4-hydroxyphenylacetate decarboxylase large subunit [Serratia ficaria]CAI2031009.1 4-hydroxyphenylacetate decarboxylase large subunit [Serratia ficaria]CAI2539812.1 4-hydroxyphenylacetate decarboxylase large subunit [Serratia ficaria]
MKKSVHHQSLPSRVRDLRDRYLQARPFISISRARAITEVYRSYPGLTPVLLRAKAFRRACQTAPLWIAQDELIISHPAGGPRGGEIAPEIAWRWVADELDTMISRAQDPYLISEKDKQELRDQILPFWQGRSLDEMAETRLRQAGLWEWSHQEGICDLSIKTQNGGGDSCPGYDNILLRLGMGGVRRQARDALDALEDTDHQSQEKYDYYLAVIETCDGAIEYATRYAEYAWQLAEESNDPLRQEELRRLAAICRRVPEHPPQDFQEALQSVWFIQSLFTLEENQTGISLGRADQYLWPLLEADLLSGHLTEDQAHELIACWLIKMSESLWICSVETAMYFAGYQPFINLVVGGQKREGGDATNPLSLMFMECSRQLKIYQPGLAVRIHNRTPQRFLRKVVDVIRAGIGFPACHFDDAHIKMMLRKGFDYEDARDYCLMGCVEPQKSGKLYQWTSAGYTTFTSAIELAFNNGRSKAGIQVGPLTGDIADFTDYAAFEHAVHTQLRHIIHQAARATLILQKLHRDYAPKPLISCLIEGCMEKGQDVMHGGAIVNNGPGLIWTGMADYANSMMVMRELVYHQQQLSPTEMAQALHDNFQDADELRQSCLSVAKFGNDLEEVDLIARDLIRFTEYEHRRYRMLYGQFTHGTLSISNNTPFGLITGALPSGRLAGQPLADGISPSQQTDNLGPTAIINSVSRINVEEMEIGMVHNFKLMYGMLDRPEGEQGIITLLRTASLLGNAQMQFSYIDNETLLKAQQDPDSWRNLMIRVAGYSAFFTELSREVQDEIISRTMLQNV